MGLVWALFFDLSSGDVAKNELRRAGFVHVGHKVVKEIGARRRVALIINADRVGELQQILADTSSAPQGLQSLHTTTGLELLEIEEPQLRKRVVITMEEDRAKGS